MDDDGTKTLRAEELGPEVGMALRAAKRQGVLATAGAVLFQGILSAPLGGDSASECFFVKPVVASGNVAVIHFIGDAEIVKRHEQIFTNAAVEIAAVNEVFLTVSEEISAIRAFGCGGEAEQELGGEMGDELAIRGGGRVMELIDIDVIKTVTRELTQVRLATEGSATCIRQYSAAFSGV